uniref:Putative DNA binding, helix-turn-helix domain containing protein n=1 Tax=viral metagenome TaxID=1070528 RepID=A0A6H1ZNN6_9ZZZZ
MTDKILEIEKFDKKILGENLSILRRRNKLSQADLAWILKSSVRNIQRIERGELDLKNSLLIELLEEYKYEGDIRDLYKKVLV